MSELSEAVAHLTNQSRQIPENRVAVVVYKEHLDVVLARLAELEAAVKPEPDTLSNLKVGDKVEVLIDWATVYKGTIGVVKDIISDEFSIQVMLRGHTTPVGFRRRELSKVA